jgi:SAM-dependent methyltransferase
MGNKHDILKRKSFLSYKPDPFLIEHLNKIKAEYGVNKNSEIKILDWGCGKGRAVLYFLEQGYDAYGVDIDLKTLKNGFSLFNEMGYDAQKRLVQPAGLDKFEDGCFHVIYSEQVFEHVEKIEEVIQVQNRLMKNNGLGCHIFPAAKNIRECHVNMPFVHWLPKHPLRKLWISLMILFSKKPDKDWPEIKDSTFFQEVNVYYNYLNKKTFYRSISELVSLFEEYNLMADYRVPGMESIKRKILPDFLVHNGFPNQQVYLTVYKNRD